MDKVYIEQIQELISNPEKLLERPVFTRGIDISTLNRSNDNDVVGVGQKKGAVLPDFLRYEVTEETFAKEYDPNCHDVLFDDNIPSFCVKYNDGNIKEIKHKRTSIPIQRELTNKQTMHLAANPLKFTLLDINPSETIQENFITMKQHWLKKNQEGMKFKMVHTQLSHGIVGLLYYFNRYGEIKSRILSFPEFILCPHNDKNGDRILESIYYRDDKGVETIDSYDDTYRYRHIKKAYSDGIVANSGWSLISKEEHGFSEIPLITKMGDVAWNNVQPLIESYEELMNVFNAIQKRHGKGLLYIKGKFKEGGKLGDGYILNDTSVEGKGDAKYLSPPSPQGMIETLDNMLNAIQLGASTTFLLPKDIKTGGDIAGITMKLVQSIDIENAMQKVIEWQNVADKMVRLFKEGLAKELVNKGINPNAVTEFASFDISASFDIWIPLSETEYNSMIIQLAGAGLISKETGIEMNTISKPDEKARVKQEGEERERKELQKQEKTIALQTNDTNTNGNEKEAE
jgi:hypothetical protein